MLADHEAAKATNVRRAAAVFLERFLEQECKQHNSSTGGRRNYGALLREGEREAQRHAERFAQGGRAGR
jgi:hypothetical protein